MAAAQLHQLTQTLKEINGQIEKALSPSLAPSSPSPAPAASPTTSVPKNDYEVVRQKAAYGDLRNAAGNFDMDAYLASQQDVEDPEDLENGNSGGKKRSRRRKTLRRRRNTLRRKKNKRRVHVRS